MSSTKFCANMSNRLKDIAIYDKSQNGRQSICPILPKSVQTDLAEQGKKWGLLHLNVYIKHDQHEDRNQVYFVSMTKGLKSYNHLKTEYLSWWWCYKVGPRDSKVGQNTIKEHHCKCANFHHFHKQTPIGEEE